MGPEAESRKQLFFRLRVIGLCGVLALVLLYAWRDRESRRSRTEWDRTLYVALVVLRVGPVTDESIEVLRDRTQALEDRLASEMRRYRPSPERPFRWVVHGPVQVQRPPPSPRSDGIVDLARHAFELWRYRAKVDEQAKVDPDLHDASVYVVTRPPDGDDLRFVEGMSQQGGRVGVVEVQLDESMADLALFVAAHELFHTLGATDKYDAEGRARVPEGLAEPERSPLYPQTSVELMARNRPIAPDAEAPPESLDELRINAFTAREIGWATEAP